MTSRTTYAETASVAAFAVEVVSVEMPTTRWTSTPLKETYERTIEEHLETDRTGSDPSIHDFGGTARRSAGGVYASYLDRDEDDRVRAAYGENYERRVDVQGEWDPENLFSRNQNVEGRWSGAPQSVHITG